MRSFFLGRCQRGCRSALALLCTVVATWMPLAAAAAPPPQGAPAAARSDNPWPYTVRLDANNVLQVFPPQVDSWDGFHLHARAAVVMRESGTVADSDKDTRAIYGTIEIDARTLVDKGTRRGSRCTGRG